MHNWGFCGNEMTNQFKINWLSVRNVNEEVHFSRQYLDMKMEEGSGAGFHTLDDKDCVPTDSDEGDQLRPAGRPGANARLPGRIETKKSTQNANEANTRNIVDVGERMMVWTRF